jgi:hypothetical protein
VPTNAAITAWRLLAADPDVGVGLEGVAHLVTANVRRSDQANSGVDRILFLARLVRNLAEDELREPIDLGWCSLHHSPSSSLSLRFSSFTWPIGARKVSGFTVSS